MNLIVVDIQQYQRPYTGDFFVALSLTFAKPDHGGLGMKVSTNIAIWGRNAGAARYRRSLRSRHVAMAKRQQDDEPDQGSGAWISSFCIV
jgi:hypothetical protein